MRRLSLLTLVFLSLLAATFGSPKPKAQKNVGTQSSQATSTATSQTTTATSFSPSIALTVSVMPGTAQVTAGSTQQFSATVTGTTNQYVLWSISGSGCQALSCGTVNASGLYTAPATVPSAPVITITALAFADFTTFGKASVTITAQGLPTVTVAPSASQLNPGGQQQFTANLTGNPGTQVSWSVSGTGCGYNCGTITPSGLYTAPATVPSPNTVTITAQAGIYPVYRGTAQVTILGSNSTGTLTVSPASVQLGAGGQQFFSASSNGVATSSVAWSLSGSGCTGSGCGAISTSGQYSAPATISAAATVTVTASSVPAGKSGSATITLSPAVSVSVNPPTAQVSTSSQQQFTATVSNSSNTSVAWSVSCATNSCGSVTSGGLYTAPATVPYLNSVSVTATSLADLTKKATATVTITSASAATISISPSSNVQVNTGNQQQFSATVTGPSNTAVTWSVSGQGCVGSSCGTITQAGMYTAPSSAPFFGSVSVTATSQANSSSSASVPVQIIQIVGITLSPWTSPLTSGGLPEQFVATVTGSSNTGVNWSISGPACQIPGSCGAISSSGLYTAPSGVTSPIIVTITATAQANPSKTISASITVVPPVVVTVSPGVVTASINSQQQYTATVTGTSNTAVQWSVSGPGCSGSACGLIVSTNGNTVTYQAPASIPTPATVNVTATSVSTPAKSSSALVTIVSTNNSKLNGQYAFQFSGVDGSVSYQAIGSFVADGNGNITSGIEDINCGPGATDVICGSGPVAGMAFSGTYNLNADNRGTLTVTSSLGSFTFSIALATVTGDLRFIETDNTTVRGSGVIKPQVRKDFVLPANQMFGNSGFALGMTGVDASGGRVGVLGSMIMGRGSLLDGTLRINDRVLHCGQGSACQDTTYLLPASGPNLQGTFTLDSITGRGSITITAPGFATGVLNLTMYVVSATDYFVISSDPVTTSPLLSGEGLQQQLPASNFFFQTGTSIISWSAVNGGVADAVVGSISFSVAGRNASVSHFIFDENNGGFITLYNVVCPSCGFLYLGNNEELLSGPSITSFHLFPFGLNSAFVLGSTSSVQFGRIESQSPTLSATYAFGSDGLVDPATPLISGTEYLSLSKVTGNEDLSQVSGFANNLAMTGTWISSGGEFSTSLTMPSPQQAAYWVVSYSKAIGLQVDSGSIPNLIILEQ